MRAFTRSTATQVKALQEKLHEIDRVLSDMEAYNTTTGPSYSVPSRPSTNSNNVTTTISKQDSLLRCSSTLETDSLASTAHSVIPLESLIQKMRQKRNETAKELEELRRAEDDRRNTVFRKAMELEDEYRTKSYEKVRKVLSVKKPPREESTLITKRRVVKPSHDQSPPAILPHISNNNNNNNNNGVMLTPSKQSAARAVVEKRKQEIVDRLSPRSRARTERYEKYLIDQDRWHEDKMKKHMEKRMEEERDNNEKTAKAQQNARSLEEHKKRLLQDAPTVPRVVPSKSFESLDAKYHLKEVTREERQQERHIRLQSRGQEIRTAHNQKQSQVDNKLVDMANVRLSTVELMMKSRSERESLVSRQLEAQRELHKEILLNRYQQSERGNRTQLVQEMSVERERGIELAPLRRSVHHAHELLGLHLAAGGGSPLSSPDSSRAPSAVLLHKNSSGLQKNVPASNWVLPQTVPMVPSAPKPPEEGQL